MHNYSGGFWKTSVSRHASCLNLLLAQHSSNHKEVSSKAQIKFICAHNWTCLAPFSGAPAAKTLFLHYNCLADVYVSCQSMPKIHPAAVVQPCLHALFVWSTVLQTCCIDITNQLCGLLAQWQCCAFVGLQSRVYIGVVYLLYFCWGWHYTSITYLKQVMALWGNYRGENIAVIMGALSEDPQTWDFKAGKGSLLNVPNGEHVLGYPSS